MRAVITAMAMAAALLVAPARPARAQPVRWSAPAGCPTEAEVIGEIARLLGGAVDWSAWASLGAAIEATRDGAGWRVVVTTADPEGVRELRGASCREVADAAALVVAMTIDPERALAGTGSEPPPGPEPPPTPAGDREPPPPIGTSTAAARRAARRPLAIQWRLRGDIASDFGALPGTKPGAGATAAALVGPWRIELAATYWFQRRDTLDQAPMVGGDFALLAGAARGCYRALGLDGCAGLEVGRLAAHGFGTGEPRSDHALWLAPIAGLAREFNVSKYIGFYVLAEAGLPLRRPRFNVTGVLAPDEVTLIHQPAAVVARLLVGAEVRLP